jgi:hypothetical protein
MIFEHDVLHAITYANMKRQIDDVETTFCSPATPKSGNDLDIPKRQAKADLDGPKSLSLTSTLSRTLSVVGIDVIFPVPLYRHASCDILLLPHTKRGIILEEATSDAGKRQQQTHRSSTRALPFVCGETRAKLLISAESVVLRALGASTLVWSTRTRRARHKPLL